MSEAPKSWGQPGEVEGNNERIRIMTIFKQLVPRMLLAVGLVAGILASMPSGAAYADDVVWPAGSSSVSNPPVAQRQITGDQQEFHPLNRNSSSSLNPLDKVEPVNRNSSSSLNRLKVKVELEPKTNYQQVFQPMTPPKSRRHRP